jgi:AcrR family transcriptional regulator
MPSRAAKRPRRKAKQARARVTVDAILEASARVLAAEGYASATTNRLAEAAGVSIGTLYEYFGNRDEVFDALIRRELDALVAAFETRDAEARGDLVEQLGSMIDGGMAAMRHGPALFRALEHVPGATFRVHLDRARREVVLLVQRLLERHRSELRVNDLELAAFVAVSAVEGIAAASPNERFDTRLAREMEELLRIYLIGCE